MAKNVLRLQNVSKYYYSETTVTQALRRVNLEFQLGEFVAITGESGSGKSTLLNIISGLDSFDEGEMYFKGNPTFQFDGQDWEEYRRNEIGFVFQDYSLIGHFTALDNVMAALVIQDKDSVQAKKLAMGYLEQVGLKEYSGQRASQLSSGQKQRLSIARALAKDTDIIVADEPTGNLDSETGIQVVEILKELSREKLVIMVTHNYEQAEPYVTRKIRLHDGEVVTDVPVRQQEKGTDSKDSDAGEIPADRKEQSKSFGTNRIAGFFAMRNIRMQRGRAMLFLCFFLITAVTSFLFLGEFFVFADDRITKEYDSSAFLQENDTRLAVRYPDNRELTAEDREKILTVKGVEEVDLQGCANDIRYYFREGKEYEYTYGVIEGEGDGQGKEAKSVKLLTDDQFVKSVSCLTEKDLAEGRLPQQRNEIVLYSQDKKLLNTERECYFTADNIWQPGEIYHTKIKIVGLLKNKTDQLYFDNRLCQMITCGLDGLEFSLEHNWDDRAQQYMGYMKFFPVIADDLSGNQIRVSANYRIPSASKQQLSTVLSEAFSGDSLMHVLESDNKGDMIERSDEMRTEDEIAHTVFMGVEQKAPGIKVVVDTESFTDQGANIIEMSQDLFYRIYDRGSTQASAYISSYARTDSVINQLVGLGYDSINTFRVSSTNYIEEKVYQRLEVIGISVLVLLALMILQILLVRSILKIKIKDYHVLKFIGMRIQQMKRITYLEMGFHCVLAMILALLLMAALNVARVPFIANMLHYYSLPAVLLYITYNMLLLFLTVFFFHRLLNRKL